MRYTDVWMVSALLMLVLVQIIIVPILGNIDLGGKLYALSFYSIIGIMLLCINKQRIKVPKIYPFFLLLWFLFFISIPFVDNSYSSLINVAIYTCYMCFALLFFNLLTIKKVYFIWFVDCILLISVVFSVLGLYEYVHFYHFGPSSKMLIPYVLPPDRSFRVTGPFGQPNLFAVLLNLSFLCFVYRYVHHFGNLIPSFLRKIRLLPVFLVGFIFMATGSRAGTLSFMLTFLVIFWLIERKKNLIESGPQKKEFWFIMVTLLISFVIAKIFEMNPSGVERYLNVDTISSDARFVFWVTSFLMFLENPLFGVGLGNWSFYQNGLGPKAHDWLGFVSYEAMGKTSWAHNEMLQLLAEGGLLTFVIVVFLLSMFVVNFIKNNIY